MQPTDRGVITTILSFTSTYMLQILRVVPYSATQLYSYEVLKKRFRNEKGELTISARLAAGGLAGMVATLVSPASAHTVSADCSRHFFRAAFRSAPQLVQRPLLKIFACCDD